MSLYNMLFGVNADADRLLALLGYTRADCGRFRDVFVDDGYLIIHTRNGGGNREDYRDVFHAMSQHPWYSHDVDDDFDPTYANIYFKIPDDKFRSLIGLLEQGNNPTQSWETLFELFKDKKD